MCPLYLLCSELVFSMVSHGVKRLCAFAGYVALLCVVVTSVAWAQGMPQAGVQIDARATVRYAKPGELSQRVQHSNVVRVTVQAVPALALSPGRSWHFQENATLVVPQLVTNTGNVVTGYRLTIDGGSCAPPQREAPVNAVYLDRNENGQIDASDAVLPLNSAEVMWLMPGRSANLLLEYTGGIFLSGELQTYCSRLGVHTQFPGVRAFSTNDFSTQIVASMDVHLQVTEVGPDVEFVVEARNSGTLPVLPATASVSHETIVIDGVAQPAVLLALPISDDLQVFNDSLYSADADAVLLFRHVGDPPFQYVREAQTDRTVIELAVGYLGSLTPGEKRAMRVRTRAVVPQALSVPRYAYAHFKSERQAMRTQSNRMVPQRARGLQLWLAASVPVANADTNGVPDGTADVRFQATLTNQQAVALYDVGVSNALHTVAGLGRFSPDPTPGPGQYTVVSYATHVIGNGGSANPSDRMARSLATRNPRFTGEPGALELLGRGSTLAAGSSLVVDYVVRFNLAGAPPVLFNRAEAKGSHQPGGAATVRTLSFDGIPRPGLGSSAGTAMPRTPFSGRPPQIEMQLSLRNSQAVYGQPGTFDLAYALTVRNTGIADLGHLRVMDSLSCSLRPQIGKAPIVRWELVSKPQSDGGLLRPAEGFTGGGPCDADGGPQLHKRTGLPHDIALAMVDGPVQFPAGASDTLRFTVRVALQTTHLGQDALVVGPTVLNRVWLAVVEPLDYTQPNQLLPLNDGTHAVLWKSSVQSLGASLVPTGVVYDTQTRQPVAGARVHVKRIQCETAGVPPPLTEGTFRRAGSAAYSYHSDGSASTLTDAEGRYFLHPAANDSAGVCTYQLAVTHAISGHSNTNGGLIFPSALIQAQPGAHATCGAVSPVSGAPQADQETRYHLQLVQGLAADSGVLCSAFHNNLPVDLGVIQGLSLQKKADVVKAFIGDVLTYEITLHNVTGVALPNAQIHDQLPPGIRYEAGSALVNDKAVSDPEGAPGPLLRFDIPAVAPGGRATVRYTSRVLAAAPIDTPAVNRAWAVAALSSGVVSSNEAMAKVSIEGGVFSAEAFAFGKVFMDCNANGLQDAKEPGVPRVRLFLEDGTTVRTDPDGKWSLHGLRALTHALRLDPGTLPPGVYPRAATQRHMGQADSQFLDIKRGEWRKANFPVGPCSVATEPVALAAPPVVSAPTVTDATPSDTERPWDDRISEASSDPEFLNLSEGQILLSDVLTVRLKGPAVQPLLLSVNGRLVDASRIGKRLHIAQTQTRALEYVGVTLQAGSNLLEIQTRDGSGQLKTISARTVTAPGALHAIAFELPATAPADNSSPVSVVLRLQDANGIAVAQRTMLTLEAEGAHWEQADLNPREAGIQIVVEGGEKSLVLVPGAQTGTATVRAQAGTLSASASIVLLPNLQALTGIGVLEGVLHLGAQQTLELGNAPAGSAFEEELMSISQGASASEDLRGRSAFYFRGAVQGTYLMTLAFDSEKGRPGKQPPLFRDLDPERYYPVYGDSAETTLDAPSRQRLYLRVDHQRSYLLLGDYQVDNGSGPTARRLSRVNVRKTGLQHVWEDESIRIGSHASSDSSHQQVEEFLSSGVSGPFVLAAQGPIVENSERVELLVRDRLQPNRVVSTRVLNRLVHYNLNTFTGSLMLTAPLASLDSDLNPQSIRIGYSIETGGASYWVGGVAGERKLANGVWVGAVAERDESPGQGRAIDALTLRRIIDAQTHWRTEWVTTHSDLHGSGQATGASFQHQSKQLDVELSAHTSAAEFDNPSAAVRPGQTDVLARVSYALRPDLQLRSELRYSGALEPTADRIRMDAIESVSTSLRHILSPEVTAEWGLHSGRSEEMMDRTMPSLGGRLQALPDLRPIAPAQQSARWRVLVTPNAVPGLGVFLESEHDLQSAARQTVGLGANYAVGQKSRVYARYEAQTGLSDGATDAQTGQRNIGVLGFDSAYMEGGRLYEELRVNAVNEGEAGAAAHATVQSALGVRNTWLYSPALRLTGGFEQQKTWVRRGSVHGADARTLTLAADWPGIAAEKQAWRAGIAAELQEGSERVSRRLTLTASNQLNPAWRILGKADANRATQYSGVSARQELRLQVGLAYRPIDNDRWNTLLRYERRSATSTNWLHQGVRARHSDIWSSHINYQPKIQHQWSGRVATRITEDQWSHWAGRYAATLLHGRWTHDVLPRWDVGLQGGTWFDDRSRQQNLAGLEIGYRVGKGLWCSVGYNAIGLRDAELAGADYLDVGWYLRMRFKFDERLFSLESGTGSSL